MIRKIFFLSELFILVKHAERPYYVLTEHRCNFKLDALTYSKWQPVTTYDDSKNKHSLYPYVFLELGRESEVIFLIVIITTKFEKKPLLFKYLKYILILF